MESHEHAQQPLGIEHMDSPSIFESKDIEHRISSLLQTLIFRTLQAIENKTLDLVFAKLDILSRDMKALTELVHAGFDAEMLKLDTATTELGNQLVVIADKIDSEGSVGQQEQAARLRELAEKLTAIGKQA